MTTYTDTQKARIKYFALKEASRRLFTKGEKMPKTTTKTTTLEYGDVVETYAGDEDEAIARHCSAVLYGTEDRWNEDDILDRYQAYCDELAQDGLSEIKIVD